MAFGKISLLLLLAFFAVGKPAHATERKVYSNQSCIFCAAESSIVDMLKQDDGEALVGIIKKLLVNHDCFMAAQGIPLIIVESSTLDPGAVKIRLDGQDVMFWTLRGSLLDNQ